MSFIVSPVFVFLFMTSPLWLGLLGHLTRTNRTASRIFWAYAILTLFLDFLVYVNSTQLVFWMSLFSGGGLLYFATTVIVAVLLTKAYPNSSTPGFVWYFLFYSTALWLLFLSLPGFFNSIMDFLQSIANTYFNIVGRP